MNYLENITNITKFIIKNITEKKIIILLVVILLWAIYIIIKNSYDLYKLVKEINGLKKK